MVCLCLAPAPLVWACAVTVSALGLRACRHVRVFWLLSPIALLDVSWLGFPVALNTFKFRLPASALMSDETDALHRTLLIPKTFGLCRSCFVWSAFPLILSWGLSSSFVTVSCVSVLRFFSSLSLSIVKIVVCKYLSLFFPCSVSPGPLVPAPALLGLSRAAMCGPVSCSVCVWVQGACIHVTEGVAGTVEGVVSVCSAVFLRQKQAGVLSEIGGFGVFCKTHVCFWPSDQKSCGCAEIPGFVGPNPWEGFSHSPGILVLLGVRGRESGKVQAGLKATAGVLPTCQSSVFVLDGCSSSLRTVDWLVVVLRR